MTIPVAVPNYYTGNGSTADYDYDFLIRVDSDILATVRHPTSDVETTLVLTTDYTVSGEGVKTGGQITLVDDGQAWIDDNGYLATGWVLSIRRKRPLTQETDIRNQGDFFPETHEDQFDNCLMIDQQQQEEIDKSIKFPETVDKDDFDPTLPADLVGSAGAIIIVNDDGDGFVKGPTADEIQGAQAASEAAIAAKDAAEKAQGLAEDAQAAAEKAAATVTPASQAEAEAWTDNTKYMTSLRVSQSINKKGTAVALSIVTDAVATDASLGHVFTISATGNFTLSNPTNAYNGQKLIWRIKQDAEGSRVITLGDKFTVASEIETVVLSTAANAVDYLGAIYNQSADKFEVVAFSEEQA